MMFAYMSMTKLLVETDGVKKLGEAATGVIDTKGLIDELIAGSFTYTESIKLPELEGVPDSEVETRIQEIKAAVALKLKPF
jgi:hypothetical protein